MYVRSLLNNLTTILRITERVQPVRLPTRDQARNDFARETGTVSGWGRPSDGRHISDTKSSRTSALITEWIH